MSSCSLALAPFIHFGCDLKKITPSWSRCLCVCQCPLLLWGMFQPNDLFQTCFSELKLFQRYWISVSFIKLGSWVGERNCLLPKLVDMNRSLNSPAEGRAQADAGNSITRCRLLRNTDSLVQGVMVLLCACREVLHWTLFCWEGVWDVRGEGMLLIASSNSCKRRSKHTSSWARYVLWACLLGFYTDRGHTSFFMEVQFCCFNLTGWFFHLPWFSYVCLPFLFLLSPSLKASS